jgi:oligoribonuclease NrnB/cAMP/cGMP phosphodiesterase (DHH superfamily)
MTQRPLVLYHAGCQDGFGAAWAAHTVLGDAADYLPVNYGQGLPDGVDGRMVYVLDFCYERPEMAELCRRARQTHLIDHHETTRRRALGLIDHPNLFITFDTSKCGAVLAWEHFRPWEEVPFLLRLVQTRDLWQWDIPESRALDAWLGTRPRTFAEWDELAAGLEGPWLSGGREGLYPDQWVYGGREERLIEQGRAILAYQEGVVASHLKHAAERDIAGHKVLAVNATTLTSEIAGRLAEGRPFGACYFDRADGQRIWSLRSREGGINVAEVAESLGGGGHPRAAGFQEVQK